MKRQAPHQRVSKKGKVFRAGRGKVRRVKKQRNYGMGYFENPKERDKISGERYKLGNELGSLTSDFLQKAKKGDKSDKEYYDLATKRGELEGYHKALRDLGLHKKGYPLAERYGRPERRRK